MNRAKLRFVWLFLHTAVIGLVLLNLLTGLRIAILRHDGLLWLSALLPQGEVHPLHLWGGIGLTACTLGYLLYRGILAAGSSTGKFKRPSDYHTWIIRTSYALTILLLLSGWLLVHDLWKEFWIVSLHFYCAWAMLAYILLHGGVYFIQSGAGLLSRLFKLSQRPPALNGVVILILSLAGSAIWWFWQLNNTTQLPVHAININSIIHIDGIADESAWKNASLVSIVTHGGANFFDGKTKVKVSALHNGIEVFFHITWDDPSRSLEHLPLKKTEKGWQVQEQGFHKFDERQYYEDKLAILLANQCDQPAAGTTHLGPKPLPNKPSNWHGKGYHYVKDGLIRDLWQWKAVRTNDMFLADDNYIGMPDWFRPGERRYSAGYLKDGKESGSYVMNWKWYSPINIEPKRVPKDPALLEVSQPNDSEKRWVGSWFEYEPYQPSNDAYPVGTLLPSVLYRSNRMEGDRADVRAYGVWHNGAWSLELARKLDTQSDYDLVIETGVCMWISAFDHSQIAHTRHNRPLRMVLGVTDE